MSQLLKLLVIRSRSLNLLNGIVKSAICGTLLLLVIGPAPLPGQIHIGNTRVPNVEEMLKSYGIGLSEDALIAALTNPKAEVRGLAAYKLAIDKDRDAVPFVLNALSIESSDIERVHMALDLALLGDQKGVDLLKKTCSDQKISGNLRGLAAQDMLLLGKRDCLADVLSVAQSGTEEGDRQYALSLLPQYFGDAKGAPKEVLNLICGRLTDSSPFVRLQAAIVLSQLGNSQQAAVLEDAIAREPEQTVRDQMEETLSKLKGKPPK